MSFLFSFSFLIDLGLYEVILCSYKHLGTKKKKKIKIHCPLRSDPNVKNALDMLVCHGESLKRESKMLNCGQGYFQ